MPTPANNARVPVAKALAGVAGVNDRLQSEMALTIISTAVRQRLLLDSWRKSMLAREATAPSVRELQNWLRVNPHPSIGTLRAFRDGRLMDHLRMVMPGNPAGRKQLDRFLDLLR